jgi:hypothetical protein
MILNRDPRILHIHEQLIFHKDTNNINGKRIMPSVNGAGKTGYPLQKNGF